MELQVIKALEGTTQATVLHNGLGLIERNVWMTLQLVERQLVNIYFSDIGTINHEIGNGISREVLNLAQLLRTDISAQALTVADDATGKGLANTRHLAKLESIGSIKVDTRRHLHLNGIFQCVTLIVLLLSYQRSSRRCVVRGDTNIRLQLTILFYCKPIETGKILLLAIDTPSRAILIYITHLPRTKPKTKQLGGVSGVGVEGEALSVEG